MIGYQQPDLSINWTVAHIMLVIGHVNKVIIIMLLLYSTRHFACAVAVHFVE